MNRWWRRAAVLIGFVVVLVTSACSTATPVAERAGAAAAGCISDFDPAADYFPVKSRIEHATNFSLRYERSYQVLTVNQPYPGGAPESYVLLTCGAPAPQLPPDLAGAPMIETPVRSLYSESTTQLSLIVDLGTLDVLTGVGNPDFVSGAEVRTRIADGSVARFAENQQLNTEQVITADPDVLLSQGTDNPAFPTLRNAGIPVIGWAEYLDSGPLAKAEWIKAMAALTGQEERAAAVFGEIESRYREITATAAAAPAVPVVLGNLYQGTWSVPAGGSTTGTLVRDAGGTYSEAGNSAAGSVQRDFETVYATDGAAAVWLVTTQWTSMADVTAADPRYAELAAVKSGQVWNANKRLGPTGGNEFYERGVTHPDEVLADLIAILHPDLLPGHEFVYFQRLGS
ncbi:ABC transporter substrate-binding protein [Pseudonocardia asaccharolytica]|uniref:ABC transporter substrate-binding protein n=1 Tax=Pseudonocardia asaccharolytica DSM 44247 = NBRC 16224 TaxID=1123024 RepID=A0A511D683_9PSEU|nr:ABC transporter substrate-binding protein [Pseudonocardia asaccharolytica]GEL20299.1 ABC transporter substrate-binding protein [Pseudonocardia asaccharolytica DSM 44247 = NBRC 16224]